MATNMKPSSESSPQTENRLWSIYALRGYAAIVARKHGLATPLEDIENLSDEELVSRLSLVRDLAHLPPG